MTARRTDHGSISLRCDAPEGCTATHGLFDTYPSDYAARVDAAELGWATYIGSMPFRDRCPAHAAREDEQ